MEPVLTGSLEYDNITKHKKCPNGGIGRRTRLKIVRETMWVRVPLWAPNLRL